MKGQLNLLIIVRNSLYYHVFLIAEVVNRFPANSVLCCATAGDLYAVICMLFFSKNLSLNYFSSLLFIDSMFLENQGEKNNRDIYKSNDENRV